jgi:hypothetical protein
MVVLLPGSLRRHVHIGEFFFDEREETPIKSGVENGFAGDFGFTDGWSCRLRNEQKPVIIAGVELLRRFDSRRRVLSPKHPDVP